MFARQQPWTNLKIWVPCGKPLKNKHFYFEILLGYHKVSWWYPNFLKRKFDTSALKWRVTRVFWIIGTKIIWKNKRTPKKVPELYVSSIEMHRKFLMYLDFWNTPYILHIFFESEYAAQLYDLHQTLSSIANGEALLSTIELFIKVKIIANVW